VKISLDVMKFHCNVNVALSCIWGC